MQVQRFYKRGDKSVYYDIPYAGDEYIQYSEGKPIVTHENVGNIYTLSTGVAGTSSVPVGMSIQEFIDKFQKEKDMSAYGYYVFLLEGKNGGKAKVNGVEYETPFIQFRHINELSWECSFVYGYDVSYTLFMNVVVGSKTGKWNEVFRPFSFPSSSLPDDTIYNFNYNPIFLTRQSITDTIKMTADNNGTITDNIFYFRTNYYHYDCSVSNGNGNVSGACNCIMRVGDAIAGGSSFGSYYTLNWNRANKILNGLTYDDVVVDDDEGTYDNDSGDGGTGTGNVPSGEDIDEPDKPGKNGASTGLLRGYVLTQAQTTTFSSWLWTADVMDYISKLFTSNPLDSIITFSMLPYTPQTNETPTNIVLGGKACTDVSDALIISEQFSTFEFTYDGLTEPVWGNALDFEKGVKIELFIPFVGIVPLDVNSVIYTKLKLKYIIDCFSGQGIVYLVSQKSDSTWDGERKKCLLGQWTFNCKSTLPLTRNDISSIISGAIGGITSLATGNIGGVASAVMSARPSVQRSGDVATSTAYMGKRNPYIIYTMSKAVIPKGEYGKKGRPQYAVKKVGDCEGFIQCENPRLSFNGGDGQFPTDEEIKEIYSLLQEGVVV